jgi:hypothetical protein
LLPERRCVAGFIAWFLAMIAAVFSVALLIAGGMFVAMRQIEQNESQEMNTQGERFLARPTVRQLRESLDDLEAQLRNVAMK